jgi:hypothetical protein
VVDPEPFIALEEYPVEVVEPVDEESEEEFLSFMENPDAMDQELTRVARAYEHQIDSEANDSSADGFSWSSFIRRQDEKREEEEAFSRRVYNASSVNITSAEDLLAASSFFGRRAATRAPRMPSDEDAQLLFPPVAAALAPQSRPPGRPGGSEGKQRTASQTSRTFSRSREQSLVFKFLQGENFTAHSNVLLFPFNYTRFLNLLRRVEDFEMEFHQNATEQELTRYQDHMRRTQLSVRREKEEKSRESLQVAWDILREDRAAFYAAPPLTGSRAAQVQREKELEFDRDRRLAAFHRAYMRGEYNRSALTGEISNSTGGIDARFPFWDMPIEQYSRFVNSTRLQETGPDWTLIPDDNDTELIQYAADIYDRLNMENHVFTDASYVFLPSSILMPARQALDPSRYNATVEEARRKYDPFWVHQAEMMRSDFHLNYYTDYADPHPQRLVVCSLLTQVAVSREQFLAQLALVKRMYREFREYLQDELNRVDYQILIYTEDFLRNPYVVPEMIYRRFDYNLTTYTHCLSPGEWVYLSMKNRLNNTNLPIVLYDDPNERKQEFKRLWRLREETVLPVPRDMSSVGRVFDTYMFDPIEVQQKLKDYLLRKGDLFFNDSVWEDHVGHYLYMWAEGQNPYLLVNGKVMKDVWGGINPAVLLSPRNLLKIKKRLKFALEEEHLPSFTLTPRMHRWVFNEAPPTGDCSEIDYHCTDPSPPSQEELDRELTIARPSFRDEEDDGR